MKLSIDLLKLSGLLCFLVTSEIAFSAPQVKTYKMGELQTYLSSDFLYATQTFNDGGSSQSLTASGDYYYLLQMPFGARYSLTDEWAVDLSAQYAYAESKSSDPIYRATRNNSNISSVRIATDYLLVENPLELIPEFEFIYPFDKNSNDSDVVMISEGVMELTAALRAQQSFGSMVVFGRLGYTYRAEGRSNLLPMSIAGAYNMGHTLIGAELGGFFSVSDDTDKNNQLLRNATINRANAGVRRFYAPNPSVIDLTTFINMDLSKKWSWDINAGYYLSGNNFAQGPHVGTTITFNWDFARKITRQQRPMSVPLDPESQLSTDKDINMFKEEVHDGVDQKIFKANPNPKPRIVAPVTTKPIPKKRVRVRPQDVGPSEQDLQDQLDNTEMKIQLRRNK